MSEPATVATTAAGAPIHPKDFLELDRLLSDEERDIRDAIRAFVADRVLPYVGEGLEEARIPLELARELGKLIVLGLHLEGYGCAGASATAYGLACSLAMFAIHRWGSEAQKQEWLPPMAAGEAIGCFGLRCYLWLALLAVCKSEAVCVFQRREPQCACPHGLRAWA